MCLSLSLYRDVSLTLALLVDSYGFVCGRNRRSTCLNSARDILWIILEIFMNILRTSREYFTIQINIHFTGGIIL